LKVRLIYLILFLSILLRLYHINFPVSGWHSWRQSDTASIAKNFYYNGHNIFYPQINWGGSTTGYVESEFQLYPFIVSLLYFLFGVTDMWGRLLSVIFSLFTVYGLYLLVRKTISERVALWSAFLYVVIPLNIFYSRAFMPESMMLMCIVFGIYFFVKWVEDDKWKNLIYSALFISLSILLKIPTLYIGLPIFFLAFQKYRWKVISNFSLWVYVLMILIPVILWYWHAHNLFLQTGLSFGIWGFGEDKWGNFKLLISPEFYNAVFFKSIAERHLTWAGFVPFIAGLFIKKEGKHEKLYDYWLISVLIYFLIVAGGNKSHEYYQLPFILPAVVFAAKVFAKYLPLKNIKNAFSSHKLRYSFFALCLILIAVLSYLRVANLMRGEDPDSTVFLMTEEIKNVSNKNDLIITLCDGNPVYLYLADRKGWYVTESSFKISEIEKLKKRGAKYIAGEKSFIKSKEESAILESLESTYNTITNNDRYFLIRL
jgi:4-amino-4-deoxy-L-arabinose transferase-like glycosyltransferase